MKFLIKITYAGSKDEEEHYLCEEEFNSFRKAFNSYRSNPKQNRYHLLTSRCDLPPKVLGQDRFAMRREVEKIVLEETFINFDTISKITMMEYDRSMVEVRDQPNRHNGSIQLKSDSEFTLP